MKKLIAITAAACAFAAFAALDFTGAKIIPAFPSATINSGATNTTALAIGGLRGNGEIVIIAAGASGRTALNVTLWATNTAEGGWFPFVSRSFDATNAGVFRVTFPAEYMTGDAKLTVGSIGAATTGSALILAH